MRSTSLVFLLLLPLFVAISAKNLNRDEENLDETIEEFEKEFNQLFSDPEDEKAAAAQLAKEEAEIKAENEKFAKGEANFDEKLYEWSDLDPKEFAKEKTGLIEEDVARGMGLIETPEWARTIKPEDQDWLNEIYNRLDRQEIPAKYDAHTNGLVTPARNQQSCGSCAAFAATATHETCLRNAGTPLDGLDLAEQQLVDCAYNPDNGANGCNGAWVGAYQTWMAGNGGTVIHESEYPYLNTQPNLICQDKKKWAAGARIARSVVDYGCDETKLQKLVLEFGAVATGLYASDTGFGNYNSGVFDQCTTKSINHAVTVVGWGTENGKDFWLIKNSWGSTWGANGFIKVLRGNSECGIGGNCAVTECVKDGEPDPAPKTTPAPPIPASQVCYIGKLFGTDRLTGSFTLYVRNNGVEYVSSVNCDISNCSPRVAGPSNACIYICGTAEC